MGKRKWTAVILTGCLGLGLLTACASGSDRVDYRLDDTESGTETADEISAMEAFRSAGTWEEEWSVEQEGETLKFRVNAEISVPDVQQMSVVEVTKGDFDVDTFLTEIFPDADIRYDEESYHIDDNGLQLLLELQDDGNNQSLRLSMEEARSVCPDSLMEKNELTYGAELPYFVTADNVEASETDNQCELTEKQAQELAEEVLEALDVSNPVLTDLSPFIWVGYTASDGNPSDIEIVTDGWVLTYGTGIDEVTFQQFGTESNYPDDLSLDEDGFDSLDNSIEIVVNDQGVIHLEYQNPMEITSVTKDVELLPLEKIETIMRSELTDHADCYSLEYSNYYDSMELIYFRVKDSS